MWLFGEAWVKVAGMCSADICMTERGVFHYKVSVWILYVFTEEKKNKIQEAREGKKARGQKCKTKIMNGSRNPDKQTNKRMALKLKEKNETTKKIYSFLPLFYLPFLFSPPYVFLFSPFFLLFPSRLSSLSLPSLPLIHTSVSLASYLCIHRRNKRKRLIYFQIAVFINPV